MALFGAGREGVPTHPITSSSRASANPFKLKDIRRRRSSGRSSPYLFTNQITLKTTHRTARGAESGFPSSKGLAILQRIFIPTEESKRCPLRDLDQYARHPSTKKLAIIRRFLTGPGRHPFRSAKFNKTKYIVKEQPCKST